jgi:prepilin-type N-terminal cleavage/methylation domain-containing protein
MRGRRRGFTLLELTVALALAGVVLTTSAALLGVVVEQDRRLSAVAREQSARNVAAATVSRLLARHSAGFVSTTVFTGSSSSAEFESRCERPGGWLARCVVRLQIVERNAGGAVLEVRDNQSSIASIPLRGQRATLAYGIVGAGGRAWLSQWEGGTQAPSLIAIVSDADSLMIRVGVSP